MIKNQWYAVLESKEIPKNMPVGVTRMGEKLVFWRDNDGTLSCLLDKCCHRGAMLSHGKVIGNHLQCPFHGFEYDLIGKVTLIPANGHKIDVAKQYHLDAYKVYEIMGIVFIWWGEAEKATEKPIFFENLDESFSYISFKDHWPVHYSRCIENQLDVMHVPFVHYNTIGAGHATVVNGPHIEWENDTLNIYVKNSKDDLEIVPEKPNEIKDLSKTTRLQMRLPNIWQNNIAEKVRVLAMFVPVDEENSLVYIRFYQSFMKVPVLKQIVNFAGLIFSKIILFQDKRVVVTQQPIFSELAMNEKLAQGDLPIIEYRKRRDALKKENSAD